MANFMQAVEWMKENKTIRRKDWADDEYAQDKYPGNVLCSEGNLRRQFKIADFEATDWELLKEDKDWNFVDKIDLLISEGDEEEFYACLELVQEHAKKCKRLLKEDAKRIITRVEKFKVHQTSEIDGAYKEGFKNGVGNQLKNEDKRFGDLG